jgi:broad specificity phosphatase PhoE
MNRIYFIRHGESESNAERIFDNSTGKNPLTMTGRRQAEATADWFQQRPVTALYSSPIPRAVETAEVISRKINQPVTCLQELSEFRIGDLEGLPMNRENSAIHRTVLEKWREGKTETPFPNGETYTELIQRFTCALTKIRRDHPQGDVLVVSHGGLIIFGLKALCANADWDPVWSVLMSNCAISTAEISLKPEGIQGKLLKWASADHLPDELNNASKEF